MAVKVLILEDNPVARSFLCRVVRESFSDAILITWSTSNCPTATAWNCWPNWAITRPPRS